MDADRYNAASVIKGLILCAVCAVLLHACGGPIGPAQPTLPLESLEISGIPPTGTVGDRFPVKATATYVHGETEDVTSRVTWSSTSDGTAAVSGNELMLVGAGECEIRASIEQVSVSAAVSVAARPPGRSTLSGLVTDSASRRGVASAMLQVVDGPNAGRSTLTDETGFYSLPALVQGSFVVRITRSGYEPAEPAITLAADEHFDASIRPLPPPPFTGGTFDVRVAMAPTRCIIDLPTTGRLVLSGTARRLKIRLIQGFEEREYSGTLDTDGTFTGTTAVAPAASGRHTQGHGVSSIKGLLLDSEVSGAEKIATHVCPGGLGTVTAYFAGSAK